MNQYFWQLFVFLFLIMIPLQRAKGQVYEVKHVLQLNIDSAIGPATLDIIESALKKLTESPHKETSALLIQMTTPGGLVSTTKQILNLFGESAVPIIVWIAPQGSSATSAGAIISLGAHLLFMSQGTNIGAATPISMSGDLDKKDKTKETSDGSDVRAKAVNDLAALVKSMAESKGRNVQAYELMISQALSYSAQEAKEKNIIDGIANSEAEIWKQIEGKPVQLGTKKLVIKTEIPTLTHYEPSVRQKLLLFFTNPEMSYILFMAAMALLYFEFQAPGGFVAGAVGVLLLIFSGMGFQLLTVNMGGILLLALAMVFFIVEIYVPSFGLLSLAGIGSLIAGSLILYETDDSLMQLDLMLIAGTVIPLVAVMLLMGYLFWRTRVKRPINNFFSVMNRQGPITRRLEDESGLHFYQVRVDGQIWRASSSTLYNIGDHVEVKESNDHKLTLEIVKKV
jgi:membrane-bound serine protease (ClpP class)